VDAYWEGTWYRYDDNKKIQTTKTTFTNGQGYVHYSYYGPMGNLIYGKMKFETFRKKAGREPRVARTT
jgi:hypothetical protein